jgi:tyrosyl-tRNA synthetase
VIAFTLHTVRLFDELTARGLIHQFTEQEEPLPDLLEKKQTVYAGFDPTSDSLHVGNLVPLLGLRRMQRAGHRVIALAGGATGMVGDPSGKSEERNLLTPEVLQANLQAIKGQLERLLDFGGDNPAKLVDNYDWTREVLLIEFLRDIGKHFSINAMMKKDSVRDRLEREGAGISFTEFTYMLLQAFDFFVLARDEGCTMQIGGSDQWGNITAGVELIRRKLGKSAIGMTFPLLLNSDGSKFGKTAKGAVWLDPKKTSPFAFRQFWFRTPDAEVISRLNYFSFVPVEEIRELDAKKEPNAAQRRLAEHMTELVHGKEEAEKVERAAKVLFDPKGDLRQVPVDYLADAFEGAPIVDIPMDRFRGEGISWLELVSQVIHGGNGSEARRDIKANAVALNGEKIQDKDARITAAHVLHDRYLILRRGKRDQFVVRTST